ncbi:site-specific integrase [Gluconobacter sp. Dm-74]|uniref:tyrosine-type recombinase/integrase n=1 Tax=Gluconobacter sp. Dm-74 TaxID=2799803 RepID=UPI001B8C8F81|nr:site-specific integrase [Gluconobacter sp. Dm-74]MBS1091486.1 site-specific integrase [Gluconobacter sp. Dm-74]
MARTVKDAALENRTARQRLAVQKEPHWKMLDTGLALGYRRNQRCGSWLVRRWDDESRRYRKHQLPGQADDVQDADGEAVLSFSHAQTKARQWWQDEQRRAMGHEPAHRGAYLVSDAVRDYLAARERRGSKGVVRDRQQAETHILPSLGDADIRKLTARRLRAWHEGLTKEARRLRTGKGATSRNVLPLPEAGDTEAWRARRSTANRILTILKAALNHARHEGHVTGDDAWAAVKPFRAVDAAKLVYLTAEEAARLVNACPPDFRELVRGALLTGCRYGELATATVGDFNRDAGTVLVRESKGGKPRHVTLTDEGFAVFEALCAGRPSGDRVFLRADGKPWGKSHQQRPLKDALGRAGIDKAANFHALRHTHATLLAMAGTPMAVIAEQLGHADTRMTEKHYAHFAPSFVSETIRRNMPTLGIGGGSNVTPLSVRKVQGAGR